MFKTFGANVTLKAFDVTNQVRAPDVSSKVTLTIVDLGADLALVSAHAAADAVTVGCMVVQTALCMELF